MEGIESKAGACRENARSSTGPTTEAGKVRSRANAFKHGLSGSGVAWPGELQAEMDEFVGRWLEEQRPRDEREHFLVTRSATLAWQIDRGERIEAARACVDAEGGVDTLVCRRKETIAKLIERLGVDPIRSVAELMRTLGGCDWLLGALAELAGLIREGKWTSACLERLDALCGHRQPFMLRPSRARTLGQGWDPPAGGTPGDPVAKELLDLIAARTAEIQARRDHLATRPDPEMENARLLAAFDASPEGERIRRYLRSLMRERRAVLKELDQLRTERASRPEPEAPPALSTAAAPASRPEPPPRREPEDRRQLVSGSQVRPERLRFDSVDFAIGRPPSAAPIRPGLATLPS